jgi:hypothetical protein
LEAHQGLPATTAKARRKWPFTLLLLAIPAAVWGANHFLISRPVADRLAADERNIAFRLSAHASYYVIPRVLVLDLIDVEATASPVDLFRGLLTSAAALRVEGRKFDTVILARAGSERYSMTGADFDELGSAFDAGENPIYLIRTLPEKLYGSDGSKAFGSWSGGLIGVLGKQMEDANAFALNWSKP